MKDIYEVKLFEREGFERKQCKGCGRTFWTLDPERELCGDTPCVEYTFIGRPPTPQLGGAVDGNDGHDPIGRFPRGYSLGSVLERRQAETK